MTGGETQQTQRPYARTHARTGRRMFANVRSDALAWWDAKLGGFEGDEGMVVPRLSGGLLPVLA